MIGCLCIHGFTGAPYEIEPLVEFLKENTDWKIAVPVLPGHGETLNLRGVTYNQWIDHAEKELKQLLTECDEVYVIGFSMGGLIASYLSVHYPVKKLVLLSAAAYYISPRQLSLDVSGMIKDLLKGKLTDNELYKRYRKKIKDTPISATFQFRRLVGEIRPLLQQVKIPTLILQGESDGVVPPKSAKFIYENISSQDKKLIYYKDSKHLICHSQEQDLLFSEVLSFLKRVNEPVYRM